MEEVSFKASDLAGETIVISGDYVDQHLGKLAQDEDLSRFIL